MRPKLNHQHSVFADYFIFPKYQRKAFVFLLAICIAVIFGPLIYLYFHDPEKVPAYNVVISAELKLKARAADEKWGGQHDVAAIQSPAATGSATRLFYFDPNKASGEEWQKLGVREKTINTIQNYLAKGGTFRKPEDLKKIYGLKPEETDRLIPYVRLEKEAFPPTEHRPEVAAFSKMDRKDAIRTMVEINSADTSALIALPGIGSRLASRIINYRDKLGGFYSVDQLGETYGVPDSTFQKIKPRLTVNASLVRKIKLNTATAEELKTALIKYNVANAIVQYRQKNGPFASLETLKNIPIVDEYLYERIIHYLVLE